MKSLKEKMAELEEGLVNAQDELANAKAENEQLVKAQEDAAKVSDEIKAENEQLKESLAKAESEKEEIGAKVEEMTATIKTQSDKLALVPEVSEGAEALPDATASDGDVVDHMKVMDGLEGAEKMAYYRAHSKEIDAAFNAKSK